MLPLLFITSFHFDELLGLVNLKLRIKKHKIVSYLLNVKTVMAVEQVKR